MIIDYCDDECYGYPFACPNGYRRGSFTGRGDHRRRHDASIIKRQGQVLQSEDLAAARPPPAALVGNGSVGDDSESNQDKEGMINTVGAVFMRATQEVAIPLSPPPGRCPSLAEGCLRDSSAVDIVETCVLEVEENPPPTFWHSLTVIKRRTCRKSPRPRRLQLESEADEQATISVEVKRLPPLTVTKRRACRKSPRPRRLQLESEADEQATISVEVKRLPPPRHQLGRGWPLKKTQQQQQSNKESVPSPRLAKQQQQQQTPTDSWTSPRSSRHVRKEEPMTMTSVQHGTNYDNNDDKCYNNKKNSKHSRDCQTSHGIGQRIAKRPRLSSTSITHKTYAL